MPLCVIFNRSNLPVFFSSLRLALLAQGKPLPNVLAVEDIIEKINFIGNI